MQFTSYQPASEASRVVTSYWLVKGNDPTPALQKIIPDGLPEIIFHFGDPYKINISGRWQKQSRRLLAGQLRGHFFLQNTGVTDILGIKLKPSAVTHLFGIKMNKLTDKVVSIDFTKNKRLKDFCTVVDKLSVDNRIKGLDDYFIEASTRTSDHPIDRCIELIFSRHGMITVNELCLEVGVGERSLQNLFNTYIGLSPKFYTRTIRFSFVFSLVQENNPDWNSVVYQAGYYDQSHFIRNFKAFTGEDPSKYPFGESTLANFMMTGK